MTEFEFFKELEKLLIDRKIDDMYLILEFYHGKVNEEIELGYSFDSIYMRTGSPAKCIDQIMSDYNLSLEKTSLLNVEEDKEEKKVTKNKKLNMAIPEFGLPSKKEVKIKKLKKVLINLMSCILILISVLLYLVGSTSIVVLLALAKFSNLDDSLLYFSIYLALLSFITFSIMGSFTAGVNYNLRTILLKIDRKKKKLYYVLIIFLTIFAMGYGTKLYLPYLATQIVQNNEVVIENYLEENNPELAKKLADFDFSKITPDQRQEIYGLFNKAKDYAIGNINLSQLNLRRG